MHVTAVSAHVHVYTLFAVIYYFRCVTGEVYVSKKVQTFFYPASNVYMFKMLLILSEFVITFTLISDTCGTCQNATPASTSSGR